MNLVCRKSKIKDRPRGLGKETSPAWRLGMTVWLFLPDQRDHDKDFRGGKDKFPRMDHFPPFSFFSGAIIEL